MKKKILALCLVVALAATAVIGGTLAYFTDTKEATNTFALGNVKIDLLETKRDGTAYVDGQTLLPIVGSAQGEKDQYGYPVAKNYIDKTVDVKNTGSQNAYVRVIFAFPAKMDDAQSAAEMMLHWNYLDTEPAGTWTRQDIGQKITVGGEEYNLYVDTYNAVLAPNATTEYPAISGVYLDSRVDATSDKDGNITYTMVNGRNETVTATYAKGTQPKLLVAAQAVQAAGFDNAATALKEGFGDITATNNPWVTAPQA